MADPLVDQKLAAILAADVAGYSALMQDDERATVETLDEYRTVFREHVSAQGGRAVDTAGLAVRKSKRRLGPEVIQLKIGLVRGGRSRGNRPSGYSSLYGRWF